MLTSIVLLDVRPVKVSMAERLPKERLPKGWLGYTWSMRFRLGALMGFGAGYYLGAKAGRERYEQLDAMIRKVKGSEAYDAATDKARAVVDLGVERAKELIDEHAPHAGRATHNGNGNVTADH